MTSTNFGISFLFALASFPAAQGAMATPTPLTPAYGSDQPFGSALTYSWKPDAAAVTYDLLVYDRTLGKTIYRDRTIPASVCRTGVCVFTPPASANLTVGKNHLWRVGSIAATGALSDLSYTAFDVVKIAVVSGRVYYVTVTGKSTRSGLDEANAWDLPHAFAVAKAGDTVYVKAGNYGALNLSVANAGTAEKPIRFIGYKTVPNDVVSTNGSTFRYGDQLNASTMPLLMGMPVDRRGVGTGISIYRDHVELQNFQVSKYATNVYGSGVGDVFRNIVSTDAGNFNPADSYPTGTSNSLLNYSGQGIVVSGNDSVVENCIVVNAGAEGLKLSGGKRQRHNFNKVYSDNDVNPTDYYYLIANGADSNTIDNAYVERVGALTHNGHGLVFKTAAAYNTIRNCAVKNTSIELSFAGIHDNAFTNCKATGGADSHGSIDIANGAHHNTFTNCSITGGAGVNFMDWKDGLVDPNDLPDAGNNNTFDHCAFSNMKSAIHFHWWSTAWTNSPAWNNTFKDCAFSNLDFLFMVDRANYGNAMVGGTVQNVRNLRYDVMSSIHGGNIPLNFKYSSVVFKSNGFPAP